MYQALFDLEGQPWSVLAGRATGVGPWLLPAGLQRLLAQGVVDRVGVRLQFRQGRCTCTLLLPLGPATDTASVVASAGCAEGFRWCEDRARFDAWHAELGPARLWLDAGACRVEDLPCLLEASWLPDLPRWLVDAGGADFAYQLNLARVPVGREDERGLRKHLAHIDLLDPASPWPQGLRALQHRLVEQRLRSPWLADEILAAPDAAQLARLRAPLLSRLAACGAGAETVLQSGPFDELLATGLGSRCFLAPDPFADASRSVAQATAEAVLARRLPAPGRSAARADLFISHASADAAAARRLCAALEGLGLRCWIAPRDIAAGAHYAEVIVDAIEGTRAMVLLASAAAWTSPHVLREVELAVGCRRVLLPVRLAEVTPAGSFAYLLSGCQWSDAFEPFEEGVLAQRLATGLARVPA